MGKLPKYNFHTVIHKYLLNGDKNHMGYHFFKHYDMLDWGNNGF